MCGRGTKLFLPRQGSPRGYALEFEGGGWRLGIRRNFLPVRGQRRGERGEREKEDLGTHLLGISIRGEKPFLPFLSPSPFSPSPVPICSAVLWKNNGGGGSIQFRHCYFLAEWPLASHFTSLGLSFLICKSSVGRMCWASFKLNWNQDWILGSCF